MRKAARLATIDAHQSHELWSQIEHDLVDRAPVVPLINARFVSLASQRLGNHLFSPAWGPLIDQMWVRLAAVHPGVESLRPGELWPRWTGRSSTRLRTCGSRMIDVEFVSERMGNDQYSQEWGSGLLDPLWVL
jgi:hypothetical protein